MKKLTAISLSLMVIGILACGSVIGPPLNGGDKPPVFDKGEIPKGSQRGGMATINAYMDLDAEIQNLAFQNTNFKDSETTNITFTQGGQISNFLIYFPDIALGGENETFINVTIHLYCVTFLDPGKIFVHQVLDSWDPYYVTWLQNTSSDPWLIPGGVYDPTPLDSISLEGPGWYTWNITPYYEGIDAGEITNLGLLFRADSSGENIRSIWATQDYSVNTSYVPYIQYNIDLNEPVIEIPEEAPSVNTTIPEDSWAWLGYLNFTNKTGEEVYNSIPSCVYVVMQNTTTGYYYTYGLGMVESFIVSYGNAVAILTEAESYWDHK